MKKQNKTVTKIQKKLIRNQGYSRAHTFEKNVDSKNVVLKVWPYFREVVPFWSFKIDSTSIQLHIKFHHEKEIYVRNSVCIY